jgi:antitoxin VapB
MATAKVFMSGRSQAVRLPKEFRVDARELAIRKEGNSLVLTPVNDDWGRFFSLLQDFENVQAIERNQPEAQQMRKSLDDK